MVGVPVSAQILSARSTRRLARELGVPTITRAWVNNTDDHQVVRWVTWDHVHGLLDRRTGAWEYADPDDPHEHWCVGDDGELLKEIDPFEDDGRWPTLAD